MIRFGNLSYLGFNPLLSNSSASPTSVLRSAVGFLGAIPLWAGVLCAFLWCSYGRPYSIPSFKCLLDSISFCLASSSGLLNLGYALPSGSLSLDSSGIISFGISFGFSGSLGLSYYGSSLSYSSRSNPWNSG